MADPQRNIADHGSNPQGHSSGRVLRPAGQDGGGYPLVQNSEDSPPERPGYDSKNDPLLTKELPGFATTALLGTLTIFLAAFITVSPFTSTPWRLGLTRQVSGYRFSAKRNETMLSEPCT